MRVVVGVAVGIALLLFSGAALLTLLPSDSRGYDCGTWISPAFDSSDSRYAVSLVGRADAEQRSGNATNADGLLREAQMLTEAHLECDESLADREVWSLVTFAAGALVPLGMIVIAMAVRPRGARGPETLAGLPPRG
ncbi:hypothetical protein [Nocardioides sp. ChNu-99]|uniref:hypothetical protein n=1 Tax=Nocardioides sp. ChNu-99 TaxID=2839897 RepID=UPI0024056BD2|nr:hypothetical protein [Nocardioides sp. ChNu-99]MDF9716033.1 hypothetical protein [Nocardioides sp. ChNu-99]